MFKAMHRLHAFNATLKGLHRSCAWQAHQSRPFGANRVVSSGDHPAGVQDRLERTQVELAYEEEPQQLIIVDDFLPNAGALRSHFTSRCAGNHVQSACSIRRGSGLQPSCRFRNPLQTTSDRFCWDYWHVEGQYTLLRCGWYSVQPDPSATRRIDGVLRWRAVHAGHQRTSSSQKPAIVPYRMPCWTLARSGWAAEASRLCGCRTMSTAADRHAPRLLQTRHQLHPR